MEQLEETIRNHILTELLEAAPDEPLANDTPLLDGVILDSISVASLMSFLEDQYQVVVEADDLSSGKMNTIESIAGMVRAKRPDL